VEQRRFLNQYQPQPLVMGTLLCYVNAFFLLISGYLLFLIIAAGLAGGGYGIANEKKWGYGLAVASAIVQIAFWVLVAGEDIFEFPLILTVLFDAALVALLLHPQSREYQRIWFK
jgi:hypothetical protein